jgi:Carbohydrate esterase, sialic acid-specific acetylesterase
MKFSKQNLFVVAFIVVLAYAIALTVGIGTSRISRGFKNNVVAPIEAVIFGPRSELDGYVEKPCPTNDTTVVAYFGQSNATNTVLPLAQGPFPENLLQYDWRNMKCYAYKEPLLGADRPYGNSITYAAIRMANDSEKSVVIAPFGYGPSSVLDWAYGQGAAQHRLVLKRLKVSGLSPQVFLWHQGETDTTNEDITDEALGDLPHFERPNHNQRYLDQIHFGLSRDLYENALNAVVDRTLEAFPDAYFGIALASFAPCIGANHIWQPVREAQEAIATSHVRAFISADSDQIPAEDRYDTCHFSDRGARMLSEQYYQSLTAMKILPVPSARPQTADADAEMSVETASAANIAEQSGRHP